MERGNNITQNDTLPKKLVLYLSPDESPLYKLKIIKGKGLNLLYGLPFMSALIVMLLVTALFFNMLSVLYFIIPVVLVGTLCLWKNPIFKTQQLLLLTNKRIYLYLKTGNAEMIDVALFSDLKAVLYRKRMILERKKNTGSIDFITHDVKTARLSVNNIPNLKRCQRIIESILYHFGGFQDRWDKIKLNLNLELPCTSTISKQALERISNRQRRLYFYILILWTLLFCVALGLYLFVPSIPIIIMVVIMGLVLSIPFVFEKVFLRIKTSGSADTLRLDAQTISHQTGNEPTIIPITPESNLNIFKLTKLMGEWGFKTDPLKYQYFRWFEDDFSIELKPTFDSDVAIQFGPVYGFPSFFEILFCYLITWKGDHNYLLSKEEIFQIEKHEINKISVEVKKGLATKTSAIVAPTELTSAHPEEYDYLYPYLNDFLGPEDEIKLVYNPQVNLFRRILYLELSIIGLLISILLLLFTPLKNIVDYYLIVPTMLGLSSIINFLYFLGENTLKNSLYIFTNQKLVIKYPKSYSLLEYENIATIVRKDKRKTYNIELKLRQSIRPTPLSVRCLMSLKYNISQKTTILLTGVPPENNLIEQINFLRDYMI